METKEDSTFIGIDLGTTFSSIAYFSHCTGVVVIVKDENSNTLIPSNVEVTKTEKHIVGVNPLKASSTSLILSNSKLLIGRKLSEVPKELKERSDLRLAEHNGVIYYRTKTKREFISAHEVSVEILKKLKHNICRQLNIDFDKKMNAVITIPAAFNQKQRKATVEIASEAGLNSILLHEPTAAALYYVYQTKLKFGDKKRILVFDFGGGTLDITILEAKTNESGTFDFEVITTNGNNNLGGNNFDDNFCTIVEEKIKEEFDTQIKENKRLKFRERIIQAKCDLSEKEETYIDLEELIGSDCIEDESELYVDREMFNEANAELFERAIELLRETFYNTTIKKEEIQQVLMIGGSSIIPRMRELIEKEFGKEKIAEGIEPLITVVKGAALFGSMSESRIVDIIPSDIRMERYDGSSIIIFSAGTTLPATKTLSILPSANKASSVQIRIFEGNFPLAAMNQFVDEFIFEGLAEVDIENAHLELTFQCDNCGVLTVNMIDYNNEHRKEIKTKSIGEIKKWIENKSLVGSKYPTEVTAPFVPDTASSVARVMEEK